MKIKKVARAILSKIMRILRGNPNDRRAKEYVKKYKEFSFSGIDCKSYQNYEAVITRLYHTVEKGLSYEGEQYRAGFGKSNINEIILCMNAYIKDGYSEEKSFYRTSLDVLHKYVEKNNEYGLIDEQLEKRISELPGSPNGLGGVIVVNEPQDTESWTFKELVTSRHSIRWFSDEEIEEDTVKEAIRLAQYTPSACNRQGWQTILVSDKKTIDEILKNQNGNSGFGDRIQKLLLVTADLRYFNCDREIFQPFIDGGMYAQNVLNSLAYYGLASIPLSASLTSEQEKNVRSILRLDDSEELILFIGVGGYKSSNVTTRSERRTAEIRVI